MSNIVFILPICILYSYICLLTLILNAKNNQFQKLRINISIQIILWENQYPDTVWKTNKVRKCQC